MAKRRKTAAEKRLRTSDIELTHYRVLANRANRRIKTLESAGLEPRILTNIKSALGADRFKSVSQIKSKTEFLNLSNLLNRFLSAKTSVIKGARTEETERRANFESMLKETLGQLPPPDVINATYRYMQDTDIRDLLNYYAYEEVQFAVASIVDKGITPTRDLAQQALDNGIESVIFDVLADDIPITVNIDLGGEIHNYSYYVDYAARNGIQAAIAEYQSDLQISELSDFDFDFVSGDDS